MKHGSKNRTLGRSRNQRSALIQGLAISLLECGQITTSLAKAQELRPFAERIITQGKKGTIDARRRVASTLGEPSAQTISKLFDEVAPKYSDRNGGYTRIIKMGRTNGRDEAVIELV